MENNERRTDLLPERDRQIQLVLNQPVEEEDTIDLGNVFHNMKVKSRIFAWVLVLCLVAGVCAPLLLYQFTKPYLKVSSLVTLRYETPVKVLKDGKMVVPEDPEYTMVTDLSAPDGTDLDLSQVTSSYVLQTALDGMTLSHPLTAEQLRSNITIQPILTEESSRQKEAIAGLADNKNADAYNRLLSADMKYQNRFVVTLSNGFGSEDSRARFELTDEELKMVLERVLSVYNDYLVMTYADVKLPGDPFEEIDPAETEPLEAVTQTRAGVQLLYDYCDEKTDTVKGYRSWKTGLSLTDWMEKLESFRNTGVEPLYAYIVRNAVTRDKAGLLNNQQYLLRNARNQLGQVNEDIGETEKLLASYKNDEIYVSMQESETTRSTRAATDQYNEMVLRQDENYKKAADLKTDIADGEDRIRTLQAAGETPVSEDTENEISRMLSEARAIYAGIREHMEGLFQSPMYATYEQYSAPQGKLQSFLSASAKKMAIGGVVGAVVACGLWFLAGLAPEFAKGRKGREEGKEAEAK